MIQKDYIMRMVEQLAQVLMKIIFNKENKNYEEAIKQINTAFKGLLGFDIKVIQSLSDQEIIQLLKIGENFELEKCLFIAKLLKEEAEISELKKEEKSKYLMTYQKSLSLFLEVIIHNENPELEDWAKDIESILNKIKEYESPSHLKFKIFQYYELTGQYADAENILFELLEAGYSNIIPIGEAFYSRLKNKSDEELNKGNLPRIELMEGLEEFKKLCN